MDSAGIYPPYPAAMLDLHLRQIRLVTILPGRYVDTIACYLTTASVDNLPDYCSLSYAWGDRTGLRQILLNGVSFNVTRNLEASLRRLRHPTASRLFWIDMLCINQECMEERTHQVNLMQLIYSGAREVFLWLGDYAEATLQKASPSLSSTEGQEYFSQIEAVRALRYIEKLSTDQHLEFPEQDGPLRLAEELRALGRLMNCSWWHRIWTVQEVVLPPKVTVVVGWLHFSWSTLAAAAHSFFKHNNLRCCHVPEGYGLSLHTFYQRVDEIESVRADYHRGVLLNLPRLLHEFRARLSTDPRDKIFGLLGLIMRDPKYRALRADYALSAEAAYQEVFIRLLQDTGNLNLLVRQTEQERTLDLPTWVPDWTARVEELVADLHSYVRNNLHIYNTSRSTKSRIRWPGQTTILGVKGLLFDEIAMLAEPFPDRHSVSTDVHVEYLKTLFDSTKRLSQSYIGGGNFAHAFWRLVSMDMVLVSSDDLIRGHARRATLEDYRKYPNILHSPGDLARVDNMRSFRFFTSKMGYIGLGPENMRVGDTVHVFLGGSVPFVLRQAVQQTDVSGRQKRYEYVGHCYVQGIMDGEALYGVDLNKLDWVNLV